MIHDHLCHSLRHVCSIGGSHPKTNADGGRGFGRLRFGSSIHEVATGRRCKRHHTLRLAKFDIRGNSGWWVRCSAPQSSRAPAESTQRLPRISKSKATSTSPANGIAKRWASIPKVSMQNPPTTQFSKRYCATEQRVTWNSVRPRFPTEHREYIYPIHLNQKTTDRC